MHACTHTDQSALAPLATKRALPAIPVAGMYRLIDIPLSSCINSGVNKVRAPVTTTLLELSTSQPVVPTQQQTTMAGHMP